MIRFATAAIAVLFASGVAAQDKVTFLTSWYAQAEHGGFYQALATGLYKKHGLDVTIRMGGPQVNGMQLMMAGQADLHMGYDFQVLKSLEQGLTPVTVATSFQHDLQGVMTHEDVKSLADLKGKTILVATAGRSSWWPWMKQKYGYTEEQVRPYTFNLQPFFADRNIAQQAYLSSEPLQAQKAGVKARFFLFAHDGFPPYGTTIVTTQRIAKEKPAFVQRFVRASMEGWKSYMADPAPANALIKKDNPNMTDEQLAYGLAKLKENKLIDGGDAEKMGIGIMTEERWKKTYDYMTSAGLLKPEVDYKQAFTTQFVKDLRVTP
ncbi:MAG TPA: ABC transporter substrate-binding protein [Burkholderiales bacterium]|jgi:NitT/TauT family transport system substrate-binding protein|nr:ABC transporter substrate-binding protein [Burkholderiales bacterium]